MTKREKMVWQLNRIIQESELIKDILVANNKDSNKIVIKEKERLDEDYKFFNEVYNEWVDQINRE